MCDFSGLDGARKASPQRISWTALFVRAYALTAERFPALRRTWYRWPVAHMYQHGQSVASVAVQREWRDDLWLFWGKIAAPEHLSLVQIQTQLDDYCNGPPGAVFRSQAKLSQLPTMLRRIIWWWNLNVATAGRAQRLGTFFLSTLAGKGTVIQVPPAIHTGCLTFGPVDSEGISRVTLAYDHRVMDGSLVADVLETLETTLNQQIRDELLQLQLSPGNDQAA